MSVIRYRRAETQAVDEVRSEAQELQIAERPNGPAAAAIIAAGIGALVLGIFTVLSEASTDMHDFLDIKSRVGPLSGKTTFAVVVYLGAWVVLAPPLWRRNVPLTAAFIITGVLLALAFLFTFPEFFQAFAD